jgi:hypothetical protein
MWTFYVIKNSIKDWKDKSKLALKRFEIAKKKNVENYLPIEV